MSGKWGDIPVWAFEATQALMESLKTVDHITYSHCLRVGEMSRRLSKDAGFNHYEQKLAEISGIFHDIGKMGIDQGIIHKPGRLDPDEYAKMKSHPELSEQIIHPLSTHEFFKLMMPYVRGHHERVDGEGYPDKLSGDKIPELARVISIVDTYDAMSQTRSYRKGLPDEVIYAELKRCAGTQFDAQLVKTFLEAHANWEPVVVEEVALSEALKKAG